MLEMLRIFTGEIGRIVRAGACPAYQITGYRWG